MSTEPTTAGEGLTDEEMARQVAEQTSSDLKVEGAFTREKDGATSDTAVADESADEAR